MAEIGAHLAKTQTERPSIFDVLAADSLASSLRAAGVHICKFVAQRYPERCGLLHQWSEEIVTVIHTLIDSHYLLQCNASFAENFYGMYRTCTHPGGSTCNVKAASLSPGCRRRALLLVVLVPYLRARLTALCQRLQYDVASGRHATSSMADRARRVFVTLYPLVHCAAQLSALLLGLGFAVWDWPRHRVSLVLARMQLASLTEEPVTSQFDLEQAWLPSDRTLLQQVVAAAGVSLSRVAGGLGATLSVVAFLLQFLQWWHDSDASSEYARASVVPAPGVASATSVTLCPLCSQPRVNDTALAVSGYVFCFRCIFDHVTRERHCPVTKFPASADHLIRIYTDDT